MVRIYTDTNVLRYFGIAFANADLTEDIRDRLLLSPLAVLELASGLGTGGAEEAFAAFKVLRRTHDAKGAGMLLLPWPDECFRALLSLPPGEDTIKPALTNLVVNILNASKAEDLNNEGREARAMWDEARNGLAQDFSASVDALRSGGPVPQTERRELFARSIAHRARADEVKLDTDLVVNGLNAYYIFDSYLENVALQNREYKFRKHSNDLVDAELLIYLADPRLHLLTSDGWGGGGFRRIEGSPQADRIHVVDPACLKDPVCATNVLGNILGAPVSIRQ